MGVTLLTAMTVATNPGEIFETPERLEYWILRDNRPHALMLSCPLDRRTDLEDAIASLKKEYGRTLIPEPRDDAP